MRLIPMLSTPSGSTLTAKNWQSLGVSVVSYDLAALLIKPGFNVLKLFADLNSYVGWPEDIILQATFPAPDRSGNYILRSPYDGSRAAFTAEEILEVIAWLNPAAVLLPQGIAFDQAIERLPASIFTYYTPEDSPLRPVGQGIYVKSTEWSEEKSRQWAGIKCCVYGPTSQLQYQTFAQQGVAVVISDTPAEDACQGRLYTSHGMDRLPAWMHNHEYLDLLMQSTALLYQRYAVMINYNWLRELLH